MLTLALLELLLLIWAIRQWNKDRANLPLAFSILILLPVFFDAFLIGMGSRIGFSDTLELLTQLRIIWAVVILPCMLVLASYFFRYAGLAWAQHEKLIQGVAILAISIGLIEGFRASSIELFQACILDVIQYSAYITPARACVETSSSLGGFTLPYSAMASSIVLWVSGFFLLWKNQWPWTFLSTTCLLVAVSLPREGYLYFSSYPFDALLCFTLIITSIRFFSSEK